MEHEILSVEDYKTLYLFAYPKIEKLITKLAPNWTVCPLCRVDDFCHEEGCSLINNDKETP